VSSEALVSILEQIRDQQKQQLVNFERALETQNAAAELQRRGRKMLIFLIVMPWVLVAVLLVMMLFGFEIPLS
jgi:hypothetical protein